MVHVVKSVLIGVKLSNGCDFDYSNKNQNFWEKILLLLIEMHFSIEMKFHNNFPIGLTFIAPSDINSMHCEKIGKRKEYFHSYLKTIFLNSFNFIQVIYFAIK